MNPIRTIAQWLDTMCARQHDGGLSLPACYADPTPTKQHPDVAFWRNVNIADVLAGYKERLVLKRLDGRWWIDVVAVPLDAPGWSSVRWARKGIAASDPEVCFRLAVYAMMELDGAPTEAKQRMRGYLALHRAHRLPGVNYGLVFLTAKLIHSDELDPPEWITPEARAAWRSNRGLIPHWYYDSNPHYRYRAGLFNVHTVHVDDKGRLIGVRFSGPTGPK